MGEVQNLGPDHRSETSRRLVEMCKNEREGKGQLENCGDKTRGFEGTRLPATCSIDFTGRDGRQCPETGRPQGSNRVKGTLDLGRWLEKWECVTQICESATLTCP